MPQNPAAPVLAVLFDYGLVLTGPPDPDAWAVIEEITGFDPALLDQAYWAYRLDYDRGTHTGPTYWQAVGGHNGLRFDDAQVAELIEADTTLWTVPNQPMIDFAARLQAAGTRTGILSNLGDAITAGVQAKFPWLAAFDFRLFSYTLKLAKPQRAIYYAAVKGLATKASNILFIDDRPENIAAAAIVGMQTLLYTGTPAFIQALTDRGLATLWETGAAE